MFWTQFEECALKLRRKLQILEAKFKETHTLALAIWSYFHCKSTPILGLIFVLLCIIKQVRKMNKIKDPLQSLKKRVQLTQKQNHSLPFIENNTIHANIFCFQIFNCWKSVFCTALLISQKTSLQSQDVLICCMTSYQSTINRSVFPSVCSSVCLTNMTIILHVTQCHNVTQWCFFNCFWRTTEVYSTEE